MVSRTTGVRSECQMARRTTRGTYSSRRGSLSSPTVHTVWPPSGDIGCSRLYPPSFGDEATLESRSRGAGRDVFFVRQVYGERPDGSNENTNFAVRDRVADRNRRIAGVRAGCVSERIAQERDGRDPLGARSGSRRLFQSGFTGRSAESAGADGIGCLRIAAGQAGGSAESETPN